MRKSVAPGEVSYLFDEFRTQMHSFALRLVVRSHQTRLGDRQKFLQANPMFSIVTRADLPVIVLYWTGTESPRVETQHRPATNPVNAMPKFRKQVRRSGRESRP
jgi:hypothetical protein